MQATEFLPNQRAQTKAVKAACAGLLITVKTTGIGSSMVSGHSDELLRASAKLTAAGFEIFKNYGDLLWVVAKQGA